MTGVHTPPGQRARSCYLVDKYTNRTHMAIPKAATTKLHPLLLAVVTVAAILAVALVLLVAQRGITPPEVSDTAGTVLAETATPKPASPDADKDGWLDIDDPLPNSPNNPDNDKLVNRVDPDDDNDGVLDAKDKYPLDQNNNGTPDAAERRQKGERYDGDGDRRPDLGELRKVALAEADKLGLRFSTSTLHLADIPAKVFRALPAGWNYVCQDKDNDGNPDATDRFDHSRGGSYAAYTHDGKFEENFEHMAEAWKKHGFVSTGVAGILGEPPRYEVPSGWSGYVPGSSAAATAGGSDPYASFYGHIPSAEQHQYYQQTPSGSTSYQSPPAGYPSPTEYHPADSTGAAPPPTGYEPPPAESAPHPPDSGVTH